MRQPMTRSYAVVGVMMLVIANVALAQVAADAEVPADTRSAADGRSTTNTQPRDPSRRASRLHAGVRVSATATDNIDLLGRGTEAGGLLEINPYFAYAVNRPGLQTDLYYGLRWFGSTSETDGDGVSHDLRGRGTIALWGDTLWLTGLALIQNVPNDTFGNATLDPDRPSTGRNRYERYAIGPQLRGSLGGQDTRYEAGYALSYDTGGVERAALIGHRLAGRLDNDSTARGFGWLLEAAGGRYDFESSPIGYDTGQAIIEGRYRPDARLRLGLGAEYARISVLANQDGDSSGWGPTASVRYTPDQRTTLEARHSDRYYGSASSARIAHLTERWAFGARYDWEVSDGSAESFGFANVREDTDPGDRPSEQENVVDDLIGRGALPSYGTLLNGGFVNGAIARTRRLSLSAGWTRQRNAVGLIVERAHSQSLATTTELPTTLGAPADLVQTTAAITMTRKLTTRSSVRAGLATTLSSSGDRDVSARLDIFSLAYQRQLRRDLEMIVLFRHAGQSSDNVTVEKFRENALVLTLNWRLL